MMTVHQQSRSTWMHLIVLVIGPYPKAGNAAASRQRSLG